MKLDNQVFIELFTLRIAFKNCRKVQDVIARPRSGRGNPHSLDCFVATKWLLAMTLGCFSYDF